MERRAVVAAAAAAGILLLLLLSWPPLVSGAKAPVASARKEDVPFIKCQVCERIARELVAQVAKKQEKVAPKKVSEFEIIEIAENVCNLKKQEADWILQIDIVEKGDRLELVDQGEEGHCNSECKTIERACQEVMGYSDTDVAEFIYSKKPSVDQLVKFLCNKVSTACSVATPKVPKDRVPGEPFAAKPSKDAEMEKILRSMEGMPGAPGMKMYSRDDLMNNRFGDGDDDEDEDDEDNFPKNLGKVLNDKKDPPKKDLKQTILDGITKTRTKLRGHINKASKDIKKWWQKKKTNLKAPKSKKNSEL